MEVETIPIAEAVDRIRREAVTSDEKGKRFEGLVQMVLREDPVYVQRFAKVQTWGKWAEEHGESQQDYGIDLVAEERSGGFCAIQCKFRNEANQIQLGEVSNFIAASNRLPFTTRILAVDGGRFSTQAARTVSLADPTCQILRPRDLNTEVDSGTYRSVRRETYGLRPHQMEAMADVISGFKEHDRGKLIMACGTGKTFTSLRIAEEVAGEGGRVLYLVPSIALLQQSMREWAEQQVLPHRYVGICSDSRAGRAAEDVGIDEVEIPVTTNPNHIAAALAEHSASALQVVFCTYQSLNLVEEAQQQGVSRFDLVICDEAHRTTGVEKEGRVSGFSLIHDSQRILADKRLYMTATPRLYTENAKAKAESRDVGLFSMDDEEVYGPQFHRLSFSKSIQEDLLSDYKVVVISLSESHVSANVQAQMEEGGEIPMNDAAKILGCWRAIQDPENYKKTGIKAGPLRRAIAFANTIRVSTNFAGQWNRVTEASAGWVDQDIEYPTFDCEVQHVDGKMNSLQRKELLDWLRSDNDDKCSILTNARCLSEGIDVPALDAVMFVNPRNSYVDIVQAVGRVMRKASGKMYGYIILPVVVPSQADPAAALDNNKNFGNVWSVIRALRAHDDRMNAEVNTLDLNNGESNRIIFVDGNPSAEGVGESDVKNGEMEDMFPMKDKAIEPGMFYAKVVEKCGDRLYWQNWAKDVATIHDLLVERIRYLINTPPPQGRLQTRFQEFVDELQHTINNSISEDDAIEMLSQHIISQPVFSALFKDYRFAECNPVSVALECLRKEFDGMGLDKELVTLRPFYNSVANIVKNLDSPTARQRILEKLYENFFKTAMKKTADRLGIVYTPQPIVDFMLQSAEQVLAEVFNRSLSDEGVEILDPFSGTGQFFVRLIGSNLLADNALSRKYHNDIHSNEIQLLAYYIGCIHIEQAYHERTAAVPNQSGKYEPYQGAVLCDSFAMGSTQHIGGLFVGNNIRVDKQDSKDITVIVGNPPWSAGQTLASDNNKNIQNVEVEERIRATYARRSTAKLKRFLYDSYIKAFRWGSDRIEKEGVIVFVTPAVWIDSRSADGMRKCISEEFDYAWIIDCKGDIRKSIADASSLGEGGNVFGLGTQSPVSITILARKKTDAKRRRNCIIRYFDLGANLSTIEKLDKLNEIESYAQVSEWKIIEPDPHGDWINKRSPVYSRFIPIGIEKRSRVIGDESIFARYSHGIHTGIDGWVTEFSKERCLERSLELVNKYNIQLTNGRKHALVDSFQQEHMMANLARNTPITHNSNAVFRVMYRPFVKRYMYVDEKLCVRTSQTERMFPNPHVCNKTLVVKGPGTKGAFSALMVNCLPSYSLLGSSQCFPQHWYSTNNLDGEALQSTNIAEVGTMFGCIDNFMERTKLMEEDIKNITMYYVYCILHSKEYAAKYSSDLAKMLPRIPQCKRLEEIVTIGKTLVDLHLGYETGPRHFLKAELVKGGMPESKDYLIERGMRFRENGTVIDLDGRVRITGIPAEAHEYIVLGRSPLEWAVNQYQYREDKATGYIANPNGAFNRPEDLMAMLQRLAYISVETVHAVSNIPPLDQLLREEK